MRIRTLLIAVLWLGVAAACCSAPRSAGPRVLVFQDGSVPDARSLVTPAVLGVALALEGSGTGMQVVDLGGGPDVAVRAATQTQGVVAAVVAPFTRLPEEARERLLQAGVPVLSLSWLDEPAPPGQPWLRLVDRLEVVSDRISRMARALAFGEGVCLAGDGSPGADSMRRALALARGTVRLIELEGDPAAIASSAGASCGVLVWTGSSPGAVEIRRTLGREGPTLILTDASRTESFLEFAWPASQGTIAVCSCADLSTSAEPDAQAFIHAYQESTGLDAGPFAVEGYDAGKLALEGFPGTFEGLGGTYSWGATGDLDVPHLRMYRATGVRWLEVPDLGECQGCPHSALLGSPARPTVPAEGWGSYPTRKEEG